MMSAAKITVNGKETGRNSRAVVIIRTDPCEDSTPAREAAEAFIREVTGHAPYSWLDGAGLLTVGASGKV